MVVDKYKPRKVNRYKKIIDLLNELSLMKGWAYECGGMFFHKPELAEVGLHYSVIFSKEFGFVRKLIEKNKIDDEKLFKDKDFLEIMINTKFDIFDNLYMVLAIKENPIEFLYSILKKKGKKEKD